MNKEDLHKALAKSSTKFNMAKKVKANNSKRNEIITLLIKLFGKKISKQTFTFDQLVDIIVESFKYFPKNQQLHSEQIVQSYYTPGPSSKQTTFKSQHKLKKSIFVSPKQIKKAIQPTSITKVKFT
jgi:hypothetical protein